MALELQDVETFNGTIAAGTTETLEIKTAAAEYVQILIDNGTTGGSPSQYDLLQEYYIPDFDDYMQYSNQTAQSAVAIRSEARGARIRHTFTNSSGADDTYRIVIQTFKDI